VFQDGVETGENVAFDTVFFDERKKIKVPLLLCIRYHVTVTWMEF